MLGSAPYLCMALSVFAVCANNHVFINCSFFAFLKLKVLIQRANRFSRIICLFLISISHNGTECDYYEWMEGGIVGYVGRVILHMR